MLIHGGNGSGKSTLAWIMAGLTVPTAGACLIDGRPTHEQVGAVALSFQAARLQLMRSRVDLEVASAAGFSTATKTAWSLRWAPSGWIPRWPSGASTSSAAARCAVWCWPDCWRVRRGR